MSKAPSLRPCYCNPDCSVNKKWCYLGETHTGVVPKPRQGPDKALVCYWDKAALPVPWPEREAG